MDWSGCAGDTRTLSMAGVRVRAAESQVLWVIALTCPSGCIIESRISDQEGPGWLLPTVCVSVCFPGPSGTPGTNWPSRRNGTQGEC